MVVVYGLHLCSAKVRKPRATGDLMAPSGKCLNKEDA